MTEQKIIISDSQTTVNSELKNGWLIIMVIPQHVSASSTYAQTGKFCFVLERMV